MSKLKTPRAVVSPDRTQVDAFKVIPVGKLPEDTHEYVESPPTSWKSIRAFFTLLSLAPSVSGRTNKSAGPGVMAVGFAARAGEEAPKDAISRKIVSIEVFCLMSFVFVWGGVFRKIRKSIVRIDSLIRIVCSNSLFWASLGSPRALRYSFVQL